MIDFTHTLATPVPYQSGGENKDAKVIILSAPSNKQRRSAARLKQFFFQAIGSLDNNSEAAQAKDAAKSEKPKGSDIVSLLNMSEVDCDEVHEAFMKLMTGGCALVDGEEPMTSIVYDNLSFADTEEMLGDYLVNFLIPSF